MCERCDVLRWESDASNRAWFALAENRMRAREARANRIASIMEAFEGWIASGDPFGEWRSFTEFEATFPWLPVSKHEFPWQDPNWDLRLESEADAAEGKFLRKMEHAWENVALYERRWDWDWVTNPPY